MAIYPMEYYSTVKNYIVKFAGKRIELEEVMLNEAI